ncbi:MAG: DNA polymerase III subunit gamma/tau [Gammaproteobacteria bacterium]|nr:DNA polymerase III subunit gamma/tau [Gammaproteobacteria bacterium]
MSYLVLARKWRPRNFTEMVGQEHVLRALINALDNDRLHHAYLFSGTRGVGKTSVARIFAKSLNCEKGVTSEPCGECSACVEIDEGRFVDLIEVDAASRTKVDDTRELLENVQYAPTRGRYKVYLIDEVHMLSSHSFNALLKTLEEPPPHVKFLLATTDPQKLPVTVLSRCLQFNLKRISLDRIVERLELIVKSEGVGADSTALRMLGRAAEGSMRDALSLLDQAISFGGGEVREAEAGKMLGSIDRHHVTHLLEALAMHDGAGLMECARVLAQDAPDFDKALIDLSSLLQKIAVHQVVPGAGLEDEDDDSVQRLAGMLTPEDVQLFYQIAITGRRDIDLAPDPKSGFEMTLLRMLAFKPDAGAPPSATSTPGRGGSKKPAAIGDSPDKTGSRRQRESAPSPSKKTQATSSELAGPTPANEESGETRQPGKTDSSSRDWASLIKSMRLKGVSRQVAVNCQMLGREGNVVSLQLDPASKALITDTLKANLQKSMSEYFKSDISLRIVLAEPAVETPAKQVARQEQERLQQARESLEQDPNIQALKSTFGAAILEDTIRPLDD